MPDDVRRPSEAMLDASLHQMQGPSAPPPRLSQVARLLLDLGIYDADLIRTLPRDVVLEATGRSLLLATSGLTTALLAATAVAVEAGGTATAWTIGGLAGTAVGALVGGADRILIASNRIEDAKASVGLGRTHRGTLGMWARVVVGVFISGSLGVLGAQHLFLRADIEARLGLDHQVTMEPVRRRAAEAIDRRVDVDTQRHAALVQEERALAGQAVALRNRPSASSAEDRALDDARTEYARIGQQIEVAENRMRSHRDAALAEVHGFDPRPNNRTRQIAPGRGPRHAAHAGAAQLEAGALEALLARRAQLQTELPTLTKQAEDARAMRQQVLLAEDNRIDQRRRALVEEGAALLRRIDEVSSRRGALVESAARADPSWREPKRGFLAQLTALWAICRDSSVAMVSVFVCCAVLILLELMSIIVKLSARGASLYEIALAVRFERLHAELRRNVRERGLDEIYDAGVQHRAERRDSEGG